MDYVARTPAQLKPILRSLRMERRLAARRWSESRPEAEHGIHHRKQFRAHGAWTPYKNCSRLWD
jgi:hypothetical protein